MARQIIIETWCDPHLANDERVPGEEHTIAVDGSRPVTLALCADHLGEYLAPLAKLAADLGYIPNGKPTKAKATATASTTEATVCPDCGREFDDRKGVMNHLRNVHAINGVEAIERWPQLAPAHRRQQAHKTCPKCGRVFSGGAGLSAHLRSGAHQ